MARLVLKRGADRRIRAGHPWIYRGEVADLSGAWSAEAPVDVVDAAGRFLGRGFYNARPTVACRLLTRVDEPVDAAFFARRLRHARLYRSWVPDAARDRGFRLGWSEADGLPGLVVDRYGPVSVVQCLTLGMARRASWIAEALADAFPGDPVYRVDDPTAARIEGFEPERGWVGRPGPERIVITEGPCRFAV